ncbi:monocarboxylate/H+ symporter [Lachancea thermotolerans CBS 6340]|uniref:KLTH0G02024p n=1 Tax=Lachancea thermotolerans (strain ATCC 56472 / CBS 6340 / NRRL Y-8284) TaxID=559295 RepID=C5DLN1_LACTC|nr:KLTH0G02024p [Lachancea thermotolerans CBS 6340]CAR24692.1 KLTH0G02024p [Lachancea thermotolerans CBS 6340]
MTRNSFASSSNSVVETEGSKCCVERKPRAQHQVTWAEVQEYLRTRFTTLVPTRQKLREARSKYALNPFPALRHMNARQTQFFIVGFLAWTWDALDFFAVSLNMSAIAKDLDKSIKDMSNAITLVLLLRVIGAVIFGYLGDRYGRKLPYCISMFLIIVVQIGTGFVKTFPAFLGCRAIFGIVMGSIFGVASATALENAPEESRSILSGIFQEGYALGYLLGVIFKRAIVDNSPHGWRSFFWFSAGPPALFIVWRLLLPESEVYTRRMNESKRVAQEQEKTNSSQFWQNVKVALIQHWMTLVYLVILMAMFNFSSHGSQDLFPTMLTNQYNYSDDASTVTNSVANIGALVGGILVAHVSSFIGRRCAIVICCIGGGALLYPWGFVSNPKGLNPAVFFLQFFVQGAWGVVPIHLTELSPVEFRAFVTGVAYQMGNMISSASSTIEATIGERFPIDGKEGVYDYGKVMCIFMGCVFAGLLITTVLGPENKGGELLIDERVLDTRGALNNVGDFDLEHADTFSLPKPSVEQIADVERNSENSDRAPK